jgi:PAS domain-containing protein
VGFVTLDETLGLGGVKQVHDGRPDAGVVDGQVDGPGEEGRAGDLHNAPHDVRIRRPDGHALEVAELEPVQDYELQIRHRDGHITPVLYNASVYRHEGGAIAGVFAAARDITGRQRAEQEVLRLNHDLERRVAERPIFSGAAATNCAPR